MKKFLERTTILGALARRRRLKRFKRKFVDWQREGSILPMPHFGKQEVVKEYARRFAPPLFIETGTYTGHMVYAVLDQFKEIFSIELDLALYEKARNKFAGYDHVHILHGESESVLPEVLAGETRPCLFWLDAHWSGGATAKSELETPIMQELETVLSQPNAEKYVLLIDDARCFTGDNDYPTLEELKRFILGRHPIWVWEVRDDIIRVHSPCP